MSFALSKLVITAAIVGVGGAVSGLGGNETEDVPPPPVVQKAAAGGDMCAVAASFSGNAVMAEEIRRAAGCAKTSTSR